MVRVHPLPQSPGAASRAAPNVSPGQPQGLAINDPTRRWDATLVVMLDDVALLEREREQAALAALIAAACQGAGQLVVVEGTAGIGKTRLLNTARVEAARAGMRVLAARGSELEREFAYGVARQLCEPVLAAASAAARAELLAGAAGRATALFGCADPAAEPSGDGVTSFAMMHGLFWLTANVCADQPLMLAVDDLHWSDAASLRWLAYLLPRLEGLPLVIVGALRPAEPNTDQHLLTQIMTDSSATLLRLAPLSPAGSARLLRAVLGGQAEQEFCDTCHAATGGNPLLLRELAGVAAAEGFTPTAAGASRVTEIGSRAVSRRVALRLARLGADAEAVCGAVAILGDSADPAHVAALAELEFAETLETARQLVDVEILWIRYGRPPLPRASDRPGRMLGFVHPLVRAAVYDRLPETKRLAGHAHAARLLDKAGAAAEQAAAHLLLVPPASDPGVVAILRQAADEALARGSPDSAVTYLERALTEPLALAERVEVLVQLGAAAQLTDLAKEAECLSEALGRREEPEPRAVIAEKLGRALYFLGRYDEAAQVCAQAAEALGEEHVDLRRQLEASLIRVALADPAPERPIAEQLNRLRDALPDAGRGSRALDNMIALYDALTGAPAEAVVARARRGVANGATIEPGFIPEAVRGCIVLMAADLNEVMPLFDAWLAQAHRRGSMRDFALVKCFRGLARLWRGSLAEAEADVRDAMWAVVTADISIGRPFTGAYLADALMEQGRLTEAEAALDWAGMPEPTPRAGYWSLVLSSRARLLMLQGRTEEGLETMLACGHRCAARGSRNPAIIAWRSGAALGLLALGKREEARTLAAQELALARHWGAPRALGRALRLVGMVEGGEEGLALLRDAVAVLAPSPARLEYAKTLIELGAALRRAGQRTEARERLGRGVEVAEICGATPLVDLGWAELRASGARPRRRAISGPDALTPSEYRVAELAAVGRSNRDIAQELLGRSTP